MFQPCKSCKMPIEFVMGPNGNPIPTQRVRTVYELLELEGEQKLVKLERPKDAPQLRVSHFETCPDAKRFTRRKS